MIISGACITAGIVTHTVKSVNYDAVPEENTPAIVQTEERLTEKEWFKKYASESEVAFSPVWLVHVFNSEGEMEHVIMSYAQPQEISAGSYNIKTVDNEVITIHDVGSVLVDENLGKTEEEINAHIQSKTGDGMKHIIVEPMKEFVED